jgi:hypothetical protein
MEGKKLPQNNVSLLRQVMKPGFHHSDPKQHDRARNSITHHHPRNRRKKGRDGWMDGWREGDRGGR